MSRWIVVLAGGVGSRFWPLSTPRRPKQLLPLVDETPLLSATLRRLAPLAPLARTLVLTNESLVPPVTALVPDLPRENLIAEPRPAGTAAALAWAAAEIVRRDPTGTMVCVHADWAIGDEQGFRDTLSLAAGIAERQHSLVTVGIVPTRPDPGFGYIQPGTPHDDGSSMVARFVEKPDRRRAEAMCAEGYLWNSGIFVWRAADFLEEVRAHTPEVAEALADVRGPDDLERYFAMVFPISVDVGVLERSTRVLVVPGDFGWDDVGTWAALHRVRVHDRNGNAVSGAVHALEAARNVVHAEDGAVVLYGVSDLVVVTRRGLTLVTTMDRAADLKTLIDTLPSSMREGM